MDGPATDNAAYKNWASKDCHRLNAADIARAIGMGRDNADRMLVHYAIKRALEDGLIEKHDDKTYSATNAACDLGY
jgi:hypothetical protein